MNTVFPRLECVRSINFILLLRDGLYEVGVVIWGVHSIELGQEHAGMHVKPVAPNWPALFFPASPGHARGSPSSNVDQPIVY